MTDKEIIDFVAEKVTEAYRRGILDGVKVADSYRKAITTPIDFTPNIPQEPLTVSVYAGPVYPYSRQNEVLTKVGKTNEDL